MLTTKKGKERKGKERKRMKANMAVVYFQDVFEDELYPNVFFKEKSKEDEKRKD